MEKEPIALATRLLVKAQGTTFDAEAAALTAKAYRLLAEVLNAHDDASASNGAPRKRERRHLRDRRSVTGPAAATSQRGNTEPEPVHLRRLDWTYLPSRSHVDMMI